jgi:hypothetical protein
MAHKCHHQRCNQPHQQSLCTRTYEEIVELTLNQEHFIIPRICGSLFKSISTDSSSSAGSEDFGSVCELGATIVSILVAWFVVQCGLI